MGSKVAKAQAKAKAGTFSPKATFISEVVKGKRVFTAVNKRAHTVCKKSGKKTKLSVTELKASVGKGSYKFYEYKAVKGDKYGKLVAIKF